MRLRYSVTDAPLATIVARSEAALNERIKVLQKSLKPVSTMPPENSTVSNENEMANETPGIEAFCPSFSEPLREAQTPTPPKAAEAPVPFVRNYKYVKNGEDESEMKAIPSFRVKLLKAETTTDSSDYNDQLSPVGDQEVWTTKRREGRLLGKNVSSMVELYSQKQAQQSAVPKPVPKHCPPRRPHKPAVHTGPRTGVQAQFTIWKSRASEESLRQLCIADEKYTNSCDNLTPRLFMKKGGLSEQECQDMLAQRRLKADAYVLEGPGRKNPLIGHEE
eukprot:GHVO01032523.1.p1 GENE.GHVO01032523.1~~GHVO01032523.1.p1  ORF type:complete len:277 (-),score=38.97 GHVO01032523.1:75-905(-)